MEVAAYTILSDKKQAIELLASLDPQPDDVLTLTLLKGQQGFFKFNNSPLEIETHGATVSTPISTNVSALNFLQVLQKDGNSAALEVYNNGHMWLYEITATRIF